MCKRFYMKNISEMTIKEIEDEIKMAKFDANENYVFVSYLLIESGKVSLFVDDNKLSPEVRALPHVRYSLLVLPILGFQCGLFSFTQPFLKAS